MYKNKFCYEVSKDAELAYDQETNQPVEAYMKIVIETEDSPLNKKEYDNTSIGLIKMLQDKYNVDRETITSITYGEYLDKTE